MSRSPRPIIWLDHVIIGVGVWTAETGFFFGVDGKLLGQGFALFEAAAERVEFLDGSVLASTVGVGRGLEFESLLGLHA